MYIENVMFGNFKSYQRSLMLEEMIEPYILLSIKLLNISFALGVILIKVLHCDHIDNQSGSTFMFHKQLVKIFEKVVIDLIID
jgi:hypothetical protein